MKVETPSEFGAWSYEIADTKLSTTTKATAVLQLCLYTELLTMIQGVRPEFMYVIKPDANDESEPFDVDQLRVDDYMAYFRMAKRSFEAKLASPPDATSKPEPCNHCQVCNWWPKCDKEWRDADHLTLIAGIAKSQRVELVEQGVTSLTQFAEAGYGKIGDELLGLVQSLDRSPDGDRELVNQWAVRLGLLPTFGRGR